MSPSAADRTLLADLAETTQRDWRRLVGPPGTTAALLDFPNHANVGDSMIWVGERRALSRLGVRIAYTSDLTKLDPSELRRRVPEGPVLLHGGGNLGDIYPHYQRFREHVVATFPDRRVVQLPQSVWFQDPAAAVRANRAFAAHPDFTLMVREVASLDRAREQLPDVRVDLTHDAAFSIGPLRRPAASVGTVALLRTDAESRADDLVWPPGAPNEAVDWGLTGWRWRAERLLHVPGALAARSEPRIAGLLQPAVRTSFDVMTRVHLGIGQRMLGRGRLVVTDRLHAHVLCCLMGVPHVALDNTYGKIAAVAEQSSKDFSTVTFATPATLAASMDLAGRGC